MFQSLSRRPAAYLLLLIAWGALCLPNLGGPSLWDVDEGKNAQAAVEMQESANWIVPTFNYELRADKPPLLYWLQAGSYALFGVNEFAARLPSALAALLSILLTYELARNAFGPMAGLLSGLTLGSAVSFCASAHFANPDSLLNAFSLLTLYLFWSGFAARGRWWLITCGLSSGLAVLAKGPVGLLLPGCVMILFLLWERQLWRLFDSRILLGLLGFLVVAAPWYVWVALETKGIWIAEFWRVHNQDRFLGTMENHGGSVFYYILILMIGLSPWSVFMLLTGCHSRDELYAEPTIQRSATRFLLCWIATYFVFFSIARTKLPNYILPLFPAAAILVARCLDRWRRGEWQAPQWALVLSFAGLVFLGLGLATGLLMIGGAVPLPFEKLRTMPGLEIWAALGLLPIMSALAGWFWKRLETRSCAICVMTGSALAFTTLLAAGAVAAVEPYKAPRALAALLPSDQRQRECRIATLDYFQPSLVFYCQRQVLAFDHAEAALQFLKQPLSAYLMLPIEQWEQLKSRVPTGTKELGEHYDMYQRKVIVVVTNGRK